jgi:hypothetical protein
MDRQTDETARSPRRTRRSFKLFIRKQPNHVDSHDADASAEDLGGKLAGAQASLHHC